MISFGNEKAVSIVDDVDSAFKEIEQSWVQRVKGDMVYYLYDQIQEHIHRGGLDKPEPTEIIDSHVEASVGLRIRELRGWAIAKAEDGRTYKYTFSEWHYRGSYYDIIEPPEDEYELEVIPYEKT